MKLSVVIAAKNEERIIGECLESVRWADEIVIVDDASTDRTVEIARRFTPNVIINDSKGDFHVNKNLGLEKARGEWVLSLDADEIVTPELAAEIRQAVADTPLRGFTLNRRNYFLGKWIRGCGWYPDRTLRLFRKGVARWFLAEEGIHRAPQMPAGEPCGTLQNDFIHYSYYSFEQYFGKFNLYTTLCAREAGKKGKIFSWMRLPWDFFIYPFLIFVKKYFFMAGFRDGFRGLFISLSSSFVIFVTMCKLWEMQKK
jgi:Glycosyltransferases involved in cell wall biogenesis